MLSAALLVAALLGSLVVVRERQQAARATAAEAVRDMARLALETALRLRRAGDPAGMRMVLPQALRAYDRARAVGADSAEVEYVMGRLYRALLDEDAALAFQERALAREPGHPGALYERAVLLSGRYGRELDRLLGWARGADGAADATAQLDARPDLQELRARVLADCQRLARLPLGEAEALAAQGILAFHERAYERARQFLARAAERAPEREEVWLTLGRALAGLDRAGEAERAFTEGLRRDRGFVPLYVGRCNVRSRSKGMASAVADADAALTLDATMDEARVCRGTARLFGGHDEMMRGRDALETFDRAEADFSDVLARNPGQLGAAWGRGTVRRYRAMLRTRRGEDPVLDLDGSEADYTQALAFAPRAADCWSGRGRTRTMRARARADVAAADADLTGALADFDEALRVQPSRGDAREWRSEMRADRAVLRARSDPAGALAELDAADRAFRDLIGSHGAPWTRLHHASMLRERASVRAATGGDAAEDLRDARAELDRSMKTLSYAADAWIERARLLDVSGDHVGARAAVARALDIDPRHHEALALRAALLPARRSAY
jgi:tetratricopeptide (TPR) repeat protein